MPANPLTDAERTDARRYMGYPAFGAGIGSFQGWRFSQVYGLLEYRLTNVSDAEVAVIRTYLTTLAGLEIAIPGAGSNLDTAQAAVWTRNANEVRDRTRLFDDWRKRLCGFLGLPPGPELAAAAGLAVVI